MISPLQSSRRWAPAAVVAVGLGCASAAPDPARTLALINESPSLPRGLYVRQPGAAVARDAIVAVPQPAGLEMVRSGFTTLAAMILVSTTGWAPPCAAQSVDWSRAGGDLFGRVVATDAVGAEGEGEGEGGTQEIPRLPSPDQPFQEAVDAAARAHGLDPKLLHALVMTESAYRPGVCSSVGACGLTQLMPATAAELGVGDRFDPAENLRGGADYLARQLLRFGDIRLALAAFNAGPTRVARLGRVPDIAETRQYVASVLDCYLFLAAGRRATNARQCRAPEAEQ